MMAEGPDNFEGTDVVEGPEHIVCVDCGGLCHKLSYQEKDENGVPVPYEKGDVVAYRCEDCLDRWDIVLE